MLARGLMRSDCRGMIQGDEKVMLHQVKAVTISPVMVFTQESREMCRGHGGNL